MQVIRQLIFNDLEEFAIVLAFDKRLSTIFQ